MSGGKDAELKYKNKGVIVTWRLNKETEFSWKPQCPRSSRMLRKERSHFKSLSYDRKNVFRLLLSVRSSLLSVFLANNSCDQDFRFETSTPWASLFVGLSRGSMSVSRQRKSLFLVLSFLQYESFALKPMKWSASKVDNKIERETSPNSVRESRSAHSSFNLHVSWSLLHG